MCMSFGSRDNCEPKILGPPSSPARGPCGRTVFRPATYNFNERQQAERIFAIFCQISLNSYKNVVSKLRPALAPAWPDVPLWVEMSHLWILVMLKFFYQKWCLFGIFVCLCVECRMSVPQMNNFDHWLTRIFINPFGRARDHLCSVRKVQNSYVFQPKIGGHDLISLILKEVKF